MNVTMDEKALRLTALMFLALTVVTCATLRYLPSIHTWQEEMREERLAEQEYAESQIEMQDLEMREEGPAEEGAPVQLGIRLPDGVESDSVEVSYDYVTQTLQVRFPWAGMEYFDSYPVSGSSSYINTLSYARLGDESVIEIVTDQVYELDTVYEDQYCYFNFLTPQEVYDKVVVIDAGHGGRAPGATKQGVSEKDINLGIVLQIKAVFEESDENIGVYFTRTDDSNPTFDQRVQLANKSHANLFVSIHNNSTQSGRMSSTRGTQVMYDESSEASRQFAQICLDEVTEGLQSRNKGLVEGDSIYIIRTSEVPVALIEVGFMTNQKELDLLRSEEYQRQAAESVYRAILRALEEGY